MEIDFLKKIKKIFTSSKVESNSYLSKKEIELLKIYKENKRLDSLQDKMEKEEFEDDDSFQFTKK